MYTVSELRKLERHHYRGFQLVEVGQTCWTGRNSSSPNGKRGEVIRLDVVRRRRSTDRIILLVTQLLLSLSRSRCHLSIPHMINRMITHLTHKPIYFFFPVVWRRRMKIYTQSWIGCALEVFILIVQQSIERLSIIEITVSLSLSLSLSRSALKRDYHHLKC